MLNSDQLGVMELQARRPSLIGGEKLGVERFHPEASPNCAESEPDRDIELELSALDLEDNELHQNTIQVWFHPPHTWLTGMGEGLACRNRYEGNGS